MSFKEIKELRQAGKLDEALQMANQALETEPENIWNKRAAAWVYYEYLKKNAQPESFESFKENLIKIKDLQLPEDEKMVFDNCAWQIGKMVFALSTGKIFENNRGDKFDIEKVFQSLEDRQLNTHKISELFDIIREFHFTKPSEAYTFVYKAFHKAFHNLKGYLAFADWWNFEYFRQQDFLKEKYNEKEIMSIAEQAYIAYCKCLLDESHVIDLMPEEKKVAINTFQDKGIKINVFSFQSKLIHDFLPKLNDVILQNPDYHYLSYYKAKLLLVLGKDSNTLEAFLPFAKQKRNEFWVWDLMAEIFSDDIEIQFSCYCKALSLKAPDSFLIKLRQKFAEILVNKKIYNEAKTEIIKIVSIRENQQWKLPTQITDWVNMDWYKVSVSKGDNAELYLKYKKKAEEILYNDIAEELIVVEFVNENKQILNFVISKEKYGFFNFSGIIDKPVIGDILRVRFNGVGQNGFYKVLTARKVVDLNTVSGALKKYNGVLKLKAPQNFGFVDDVFIDSKLVADKKWTDGQNISGIAILSFNKKKNEWGWKAIQTSVA